MFEGSIPHIGGPHILPIHQMWWRYAPQTEFETTPPGGRMLLLVPILTCLPTRPSCVIIQNFSQVTHRPVMMPITPFTRPSSPFLSQVPTWKHQKNGGTIILIANLVADSELGSPDSYSSFGNIRVWHTDGQTDNANHHYSWLPHCGRPASNAGTINSKRNRNNCPQTNQHNENFKATKSWFIHSLHQGRKCSGPILLSYDHS